jgi:hypothetical protein
MERGMRGEWGLACAFYVMGAGCDSNHQQLQFSCIEEAWR